MSYLVVLIVLGIAGGVVVAVVTRRESRAETVRHDPYPHQLRPRDEHAGYHPDREHD